MAVLRSIESKIESLFEGVFGRAFRTHVQPIELARKLAKEMDDHRNVSVSRVYAPNEYTVYLATDDRRQFTGYEDALVGELQDYLVEHARRQGYAITGGLRVVVTSDDDLAIGEFGIATRFVTSESERAPRHPAGVSEEPPAQTMVYRVPAPEPEPPPPEPKRDVVTLTVADRAHEITDPVVVLGRSRDAGVRVPDANVSRRHAELRKEGPTYWIVDLGSTNGTTVNGRRVDRARLRDGDRITLGSTEIVFGRALPS